MLTLFILATLACSALGDTIGFFILGANKKKLAKSGPQRVKHALDLAVNHPNDHHVFFLSGANGEAEDMREQIRVDYRGLLESGKLGSPNTGSLIRRGPRIILETKANFTVKNFIMTIPKINAYWKQYNLRKVYLVTSNYHMCRSEAILDEFIKARLTADIQYELSPAEHPKNADHPEYDNWLWSPCGGRTRKQDIEDPTRDQSNAHIVATMIARAADIDSFSERDSNDTLTAIYQKNNNATTKKDKRAKKDQLLSLVNGCARKLSK
jgi:hypothetical protein